MPKVGDIVKDWFSRYGQIIDHRSEKHYNYKVKWYDGYKDWYTINGFVVVAIHEELKTGNRVILTESNYADSKSNPYIGGTYGFVIGTVSSISEEKLIVYVEWDNGTRNVYESEDLHKYVMIHDDLNIAERLSDI